MRSPAAVPVMASSPGPSGPPLFLLTSPAVPQVIIAGAGGAAHLPGMVAALTPLPVVGVPVVPPTGAALSGVDALLSIVQARRPAPGSTLQRSHVIETSGCAAWFHRGLWCVPCIRDAGW